MQEQICALCETSRTDGIGYNDRFLCLECCIKASDFIEMVLATDEDDIPDEGMVVVVQPTSDTAH